MRFVIAIASLLGFASEASAGVDAVNVYEPRTYGYFIGDVIERRVEVITSGDTDLFAAGLPRPGPLTYWLDLVSVDQNARQDKDRKIYDIVFKYQIFYSALQATKVEIPAFPLKFKNPYAASATSPSSQGEAEKRDANGPSASVPALKLTISPLRDIVLDDLMPDKSNDISDVLRPDAKAELISWRPAVQRVALSSGALALVGGLLLWQYAWWPFARRAGRPFTRASREIQGLQAHNASAYSSALLLLHRAFDESFGRRVFYADLPAFLASRQRFSDLTPKLRHFFETSQLYFFSNAHREAEARLDLDDVKELASDLSREERAA